MTGDSDDENSYNWFYIYLCPCIIRDPLALPHHGGDIVKDMSYTQKMEYDKAQENVHVNTEEEGEEENVTKTLGRSSISRRGAVIHARF